MGPEEAPAVEIRIQSVRLDEGRPLTPEELAALESATDPAELVFSFEPTEGIARSFFLVIGVCPFCAGELSDWREHRGRRLKHCFACHFEFEEVEAI